MCDYCDCRSHPVIAALSVDHEQLSSRLVELDRSVADGDRVTATATAAEIHRLLDAHTAIEETGVFQQLLDTDVDPAYIARFAADHVRVHDLLSQLTGEGWRRAAAELAAELRDHIAREESDLFPAAHQLLGPSQWDAIDAIHDELTGGAPT